MILLIFSIYTVSALNQKERACYIVTTHLGKQPEFDIRNIIDPSSKNVNKMKLMNYILYDIYQTCMERISKSQIDRVLAKDLETITAKSLGIYAENYKVDQIPEVKTNFLMDILKFQTDPNEL